MRETIRKNYKKISKTTKAYYPTKILNITVFTYFIKNL